MEFAKGIAPLVFGGFMIAAGLAAIALPETYNQPIPDTIADAEKLSSGTK